MNSKSMNELLKIKEENSKKYLKMSSEELKANEKRIIAWFLDATGKSKKNNENENTYTNISEPIPIVNEDTPEYNE